MHCSHTHKKKITSDEEKEDQIHINVTADDSTTATSKDLLAGVTVTGK